METIGLIDIHHVGEMQELEDHNILVRSTEMPVDLYEKTLDRLRNGVAIFIIQKKDGSYRKCIGTLNETTIPKERGDEAKKYHKPSPLNQTFYDLQVNEFRSFNVDRVVALIDF